MHNCRRSLPFVEIKIGRYLLLNSGFGLYTNLNPIAPPTICQWSSAAPERWMWTRWSAVFRKLCVAMKSCGLVFRLREVNPRKRSRQPLPYPFRSSICKPYPPPNEMLKRIALRQRKRTRGLTLPMDRCCASWCCG